MVKLRIVWVLVRSFNVLAVSKKNSTIPAVYTASLHSPVSDYVDRYEWGVLTRIGVDKIGAIGWIPQKRVLRMDEDDLLRCVTSLEK